MLSRNLFEGSHSSVIFAPTEIPEGGGRTEQQLRRIHRGVGEIVDRTVACLDANRARARSATAGKSKSVRRRCRARAEAAAMDAEDYDAVAEAHHKLDEMNGYDASARSGRRIAVPAAPKR